MEIPQLPVFMAGMTGGFVLLMIIFFILKMIYGEKKRYFFFTYTCYDQSGREQARGNGNYYTDNGKFPSQDSLKILISETTDGSTYSYVKFESIEEWDEDNYNQWIGKDE